MLSMNVSRTLQIAFAAWRQGNFVEVVDQFNDQFTFTDHALFGEPLFGGRLRTMPICVRGISVVRIKDGKISQWSDYYDQLKSRRYGIAAWFTEWI
jgi:hypothetical protein